MANQAFNLSRYIDYNFFYESKKLYGEIYENCYAITASLVMILKNIYNGYQ